MKTILITGAAGDVGTHLRRELAGRYQLRLSDIKPIAKHAKGEKFMRGDVSRMKDMLAVTKGVDAIVHLGGFSVEGPWESILSANIVGTYHVFEAARGNGVKRILFATSNHAAGFYRRDETIDHRVYPKPDSRYVVVSDNSCPSTVGFRSLTSPDFWRYSASASSEARIFWRNVGRTTLSSRSLSCASALSFSLTSCSRYS